MSEKKFSIDDPLLTKEKFICLLKFTEEPFQRRGAGFSQTSLRRELSNCTNTYMLSLTIIQI